MAHKIKVTMTVPEISKVDTCYDIYEHGKKLGSLKISKGGIEYVPKGNTTNTVKKRWGQLHDLLTKSVVIFCALSLFSCKQSKPKTREDIAKEKMDEFIKAHINYPESYESFECGKLIEYVDEIKLNEYATYQADSASNEALKQLGATEEYMANLEQLGQRKAEIFNGYNGKLYQMYNKCQGKNDHGEIEKKTVIVIFDSLLNVQDIR